MKTELNLKDLIRDVPDFPIPGVLFRGIGPLLKTPIAFDEAISRLAELLRRTEAELIVGVESRGFILGAALAVKTGLGFVALRKAGKLPPPIHAESYLLEYGQATLEMQPGVGKVFVIDDVLATGGTLGAALNLCVQSGYGVSGAAVLIDLRFLNEFRFNGQRVGSVITYE